jgi:hypothetical protein
MEQIQYMVEMAETCDPQWKPPNRFEYAKTTNQLGTFYDFNKKLPQLQNHVQELWDSLPQRAKFLYYVRGMTRGQQYAYVGLSLLRLETKSAGVSEEMTAELKIAWKALNRVMDACRELAACTALHGESKHAPEPTRTTSGEAPQQESQGLTQSPPETPATDQAAGEKAEDA